MSPLLSRASASTCACTHRRFSTMRHGEGRNTIWPRRRHRTLCPEKQHGLDHSIDQAYNWNIIDPCRNCLRCEPARHSNLWCARFTAESASRVYVRAMLVSSSRSTISRCPLCAAQCKHVLSAGPETFSSDGPNHAAWLAPNLMSDVGTAGKSTAQIPQRGAAALLRSTCCGRCRGSARRRPG